MVHVTPDMFNRINKFCKYKNGNKLAVFAVYFVNHLKN